MIITIKSAEKTEGDYGDFIKVQGFDGKGKEVFKNVSEKFQDKWDLLKGGATLEFKMVNKDNKWHIADILPVTTPPPESPPIVESDMPKYKPSGEERGMWFKELGEMLRSGDIDKATPHGKLLRHFYYAQMFNRLDIEIKDEEVK